MTWSGFFYGIQSFFENVAFAPYNALRELQLSSWYGANMVSWFFVLIFFIALAYWMGQLNKHASEDNNN